MYYYLILLKEGNNQHSRMKNPTTYPLGGKPLKSVVLPCNFHWKELRPPRALYPMFLKVSHTFKYTYLIHKICHVVQQIVHKVPSQCQNTLMMEIIY